jgi:hypothetical protein
MEEKMRKNVMSSKLKKAPEHIKIFKMPTLHGGKNVFRKM